MYKKVLLMLVMFVSLFSLACKKDVNFISKSKLEQEMHSFPSSLSEEGAKELFEKYGKQGVLSDIDLFTTVYTSGGNMALSGHVFTLEDFDYIKIIDAKVEIPLIDYVNTKHFDLPMRNVSINEEEKASLKQRYSFAQKWSAYELADNQFSIIHVYRFDPPTIYDNQVLKKLNKQGRFFVQLTINLEASKNGEVFNFTVDDSVNYVDVKYHLTFKGFVIGLIIYTISAMVISTIIRHNQEKGKTQPKKFITAALLLFYGMYGLNNRYLDDEKRCHKKCAIAILNMPFLLLFALGLTEGGDAIGASVLGLVGGFIPCFILFFMNLKDLFELLDS